MFYRLPCCKEVWDEGRDDVFTTHKGVTFVVVIIAVLYFLEARSKAEK